MSDIIEDVLHARYYQPGETSWEDVARRVANYIGDTDAERDEYFRLIRDKVFLPNSPCLMNAGTAVPMMSACFVVPIDDSMESIFETLKNTALIHKTGGGTGFNFGTLRPEGDLVRTTRGIASGPISFMKVFNAATGAVIQGGARRGANMGILPIWHPDIEKFVECKTHEGELSNFNISVMVDNKFMEAVESDGDYELVFNDVVYKTIKARKLFSSIVRGAWKNGEPGILFYDTINADNPFYPERPITATNPCVVGETQLLTNNGFRRIDECVGEEITIWNGYEWSVVTPRITGELQHVITVKFSDGAEVKCTPYHTFIIQNNFKDIDDICFKKASELNIGDKIIKCAYPIIEGTKNLDDAYTHGFYSGDGHYSTYKKQYHIWLYGKKQNLVGYLNHRYIYKSPNDSKRTLLVLNGEYNKCFVPDCKYTIKSRLDWLAGIVDSDGCNNSKCGSIAISSINKKFLMDIKYMLNTLGINTTVNILKQATRKEMPDGHGGSKEYDCLESYRLVIAASDVKILTSLGFAPHRVKTNVCINRIAKRFVKIVSINDYGEIADKVYCFTEPKNHTGIFNGVILGQCAEEPLLPYESCTLASIDVSKFVTDEKFDWNAYIKVIVTVTKFLNGVIDKNEYPIPEIREASLSTRKIGIGLMGFHDALITLNIPYDSIDAREFGKALMKYMDEWSHLTSDECNFNNVATTTIAPTGTIATIAQCSYGIEPNFSYVHVRNTWVSGEKVSYKQIHPLFENALLKQFPDDVEMRNCIISHMFEHGTIQDLIDLPHEFRDIFKTAMDISWNDHVMMQSAFQKYCDAGISKTINMQNSALESDVEQAIITAWKLGCKGITIYRSGSRETEVLELAKSSPKMEDVIMPKEEIPRRQKILNGTTYKMQSGCGKLYITINERNGRPYEVFVQTAGSGGCQANSEAIGRLISLALRNGVPSKEIIKQLKRVKCAAAIKSGCDGKSCADIIAKCIEEFYSVIEEEGDSDISTIVPDENLTIPTDTYRPKCPECGEYLTLAEGCMVCGACGWSKCK